MVKTRSVKEIFDKSFALILSCILLPLFLFIGLLSKINGLIVKEDRGPIFFCIERISKGKVIRLIKFRTIKMRKLQEILNHEGRIDDIKFLEKQNHNLTRLGRVLRDFYLDELPQIFNILRGELSFVGPRPYPLSMYEEEIAKGRMRKKIIRAGLSCCLESNTRH